MKQVFVKGGAAVAQDVPAVRVSSKNILVRTAFSCISVGTELASIATSALPLYKRALKQPENVKRVLEMAKEQGVVRTYNRVTGKLASGSPTGYSAAGIVIEKGSEVTGFAKGDRVACAGAGIANHAELIDVPVNLAVKAPDGLALEWASTVTLGSIAMQGVRRSRPTLGETFVVVGLGILGQLTAQFLRASGVRVIGVDLSRERVDLALSNGMEWGVDPGQEDYIERVHKMTGGMGADAVVVTAASASNEIINDAMKACRKKGRVVLVGDVGLNLTRSDFYRKEIDFLISCSYGPGRYDANYEEGGQDYPYPYVRWTENRNMEEYLRLLSGGCVKLDVLPHRIFPIQEATEAYASLGSGSPLVFALLSYPNRPGYDARTIELRPPGPRKEKQIRVALAGAGSFAQGMHLPNMLKLGDRFKLHAVMSRTGSNAMAIAKQYEASYACTDYSRIVGDQNIDLVMIATRHDLHAPMVMEALRAGKHCFVEKPLALMPEELAEIEDFYRSNPNGPVLMTGFNRRFSPALSYIGGVLRGRTTPLVVNYRMNAGYIPLDHWVHGSEGGGRNIGEACHIYDLFNFLTAAETARVEAQSITPRSPQWSRNDNFVATVKYADGSVCSLTYVACGHGDHPKEVMEIFGDGKVITMTDFKSVSVHGGKHKGWNSQSRDKGQFNELEELAACLGEGKPWPIPLAQQIQATQISFAVERLVRE